jgi:hypothetical protein
MDAQYSNNLGSNSTLNLPELSADELLCSDMGFASLSRALNELQPLWGMDWQRNAAAWKLCELILQAARAECNAVCSLPAAPSSPNSSK